MKLLLHEVSAWQLAIYFFGVFTGLFILLVALQFHIDLRHINDYQEDNRLERYIVVSKTVSGLSFTTPGTTIDNDLNSLRQQPWVESAAPFTPANFSVTASVEFVGRGMSTALFLESVPEEFIDIKPDFWQFDPNDSQTEVPIIIPRDYLALYNFGFAVSRGLPRIGENVLKSIPLTISAAGNGRQQYFNARIVGFSSRLNTIAAPQEFIDWGNDTFGDDKHPSTSRIIARINTTPDDPRLQQFLDTHNLEQGADDSIADSTAQLFDIILSIIIAIGTVIAALAIALLIVSIFLLIHKTRAVIYRLLALGYSSRTLNLLLTGIFAAINLLVLILATTAIEIANTHFLRLLSQSGLSIESFIWLSVIVALCATALITAICHLIFRKAIIKTLNNG